MEDLVVGDENCSFNAIVNELRVEEVSFAVLFDRWPELAMRLKIPFVQRKKLQQDLLLGKKGILEVLEELLTLWRLINCNNAKLTTFLDILAEMEMKSVKEHVREKFSGEAWSLQNPSTLIPKISPAPNPEINGHLGDKFSGKTVSFQNPQISSQKVLPIETAGRSNANSRFTKIEVVSGGFKVGDNNDANDVTDQEDFDANYDTYLEDVVANYGIDQEEVDDNYGIGQEDLDANDVSDQEEVDDNYGTDQEDLDAIYGTIQEEFDANYGIDQEDVDDNYGIDQVEVDDNYGIDQEEVDDDNYATDQEEYFYSDFLLSFSDSTATNLKGERVAKVNDGAKNTSQTLNHAESTNVTETIYYDPSKENLLGEGGTRKEVFKGTFKNQPVAVKEFTFTDFHNKNFKLATQELELLSKLDHPNIIKLFGHEKRNGTLLLALELANATLHEWTMDETCIPNAQTPRLSILKDVTLGLEYLHKQKVIHRDLKPANILLVVRSTGFLPEISAKIADFEISKLLPPGRQSKTITKIVGSEGWLAPELLKLNDERNLAHKREKTEQEGTKDTMTNKVDIFSLGCVYYFVLSKGKHRFGRSDLDYNIKHNKPTEESVAYGDMPILLRNKDIIETMISPNPVERPTAQKVLYTVFDVPIHL